MGDQHSLHCSKENGVDCRSRMINMSLDVFLSVKCVLEFVDYPMATPSSGSIAKSLLVGAKALLEGLIAFHERSILILDVWQGICC